MPIIAESTQWTMTEALVLRAHAKLPDDLALEEYSDLVSAIDAVCTLVTRVDEHAAGSSRHSHDRPELIRAQYGSDFLVITGIAVAAAGVAAGVLVKLSQVVDNLASAGLKNEDRLAKKAARLERRDEIRYSRSSIRGHAEAGKFTLSQGRAREADLIASHMKLLVGNASLETIRSIVGSEWDRVSDAERLEIVHSIAALARYRMMLDVESATPPDTNDPAAPG